MPNKIKILLADDHAVLRAGIRALLEMQPDMQVVGEAGDGLQTLARARELQPDVVLMDIGMPRLDGLAATRQICETSPHTRVLILTQHENKEYILPALRVGASGYVLKRAEGDELLNAIRVVHAGGMFLDPSVAGIVVDDVRRGASPADPYETLSDREREVLVLLAQGQTYQQIAEALFISVKTVDFHRANILRKLGFATRADLIRYAVQRGLIP
ncbi:MAG: response regulator transcription factor [Chloroflexi bacterium]|nr:response regulator transcription factor [Chloroflexota bacterium]MCL5075612.1 response regulator transcription factor [Chloroflexota bacterium]